MKKQIISLIILALLPLMANADAVEIDGIYYNLIPKAKVAEVANNPSRYSGSIIIPETVSYGEEIYNVTSIENGAFMECRELNSVKIPNSVTSIGNSAFMMCDSLSSITIPNNLNKIGESAFLGTRFDSVYITDLAAWFKISFGMDSNPLGGAKHLYLNNKEIKDIIIPDGINTLGDFVFSGFSSMTSITIPNSVTSIGVYAFQGCSGLKSITMGNSVTSIGYGAFYGCIGLTSIDIPNSVTSIGHLAFYGCTGLTSITIPNSVTNIDSYAFYCCSSLVHITIPNSVRVINESVFHGCKSATSVTIGGNVNSIGSNSFANCKEISDLYCYAVSVPSTSSNAFSDSYIDYATLHVPESSISAYKVTSPWSGFKDFVALPNFKLTYIVDGEVYKTYKFEEDRIIPIEEAPAKEGYTFSGWSEIPETMPDHDVEVSGTFTVNKYNLIYVVDGEEYKTVEIEYGTEITPEAGPEKEGYTFTGWNEIPDTMPANNVTVTGIYEKNLLGKCATPAITYANGELMFSCETEEVGYVYDVKVNGAKTGSTDSKVKVSPTLTVSVYATKEGYENSDVATKTIDLLSLSGDVSGDGEVDATDITKLIDILLKKQSTP